MRKIRDHNKEKAKLHPRNKHRERYDFKELCESCPELIPFVKMTEFGDESIDFFNAKAVKMLNTALLKYFYGINYWENPDNYLCPPVPGRADYIHYIADLLGEKYDTKNSGGNKIKCLDIGVGANCIYPIIGHAEYGWSFVGTDIDSVALQSAAKIVESNHQLKGNIELRLQQNSHHIFSGIINENERFDVTICNPPFHTSEAEAHKATLRKLGNLKKKKVKNLTLNFGGQKNELWCEGGEQQFVTEMIIESKEFSSSCKWFSSLISKQSNLLKVYKTLAFVGVANVKTIPMGQGNKTSRIVAWTFKKNNNNKS